MLPRECRAEEREFQVAGKQEEGRAREVETRKGEKSACRNSRPCSTARRYKYKYEAAQEQWQGDRQDKESKADTKEEKVNEKNGNDIYSNVIGKSKHSIPFK